MQEKQIIIHATAEVSGDSKIGKGTNIWKGVQVRENAEIGENCNIGKDVYIDKNVKIGTSVKIQNGVSIFEGVQIEDDVFLGPHMTFTNDLFPRSFNRDWKKVETKVCKGASIGANATIICGNVIGEYAMVGAGAVVTTDVPNYALVVGNPSIIIGYVCKCGVKINENKKCEVCGIFFDGEKIC
ncbi:acetyltransferase [Lysinibacillus contaminans]|uniref:Acetyltransferase n=2 Tax=Lysinibacillus contaminans TaxID=1293441 RepID=A0ABR5JXF1_9BACI|nr:acetyltransferase [Lysinibacillus contaminans]